ncbi:thioesterase II family protein [Evansella sp. AB-rgal1]|uniref:thioesterase II family protein n=1 Tax=Evansella sp. AB-rgal1 TaxID=3242696 RepID=UPI00359D0A9C
MKVKERCTTITKPNYISNSFVKLNNVIGTHKLFCFPHAGGSSTYFKKWGGICEELEIELIAIQYRGRRKRVLEEPIDTMEGLVHELLVEFAEISDDQPFSFFGHSLGGMVCFELCRQLYESKQRLPKELFLSSCRTPLNRKSTKQIYHLSDEEFIKTLKKLNGTSSEVLDHPLFSSLFLPMLRADFKIAGTYHIPFITPLPVSITCMVGESDFISEEEVLEWEKYTSVEYNHRLFHGDHFYLNQHVTEIVHIINAKIEPRVISKSS